MINNAKAPLSPPGIAKRIAVLTLPFVVGCSPARGTPDGFQGLVEYDERVLSFEAPGRIAQVTVRRGDVVAESQVLAQLDDVTERLNRDIRRQDVVVAQADLALVLAGTRYEDIAAAGDDLRAAETSEDLSKSTTERTRSLVAKATLPKEELDKAEADLQRKTAERKAIDQRLAALRHGARPEEIARARARVDTAKAQLALEEDLLTRRILKAEAPGEVIDVTVKPGELAAVNTPALVLADTAHPFVDVFVPVGSLDGVKVGRAMDVHVDATPAAFNGTVEYVSPDTEFTPKFLFSDRERPHLVIRVRVRIDDSAHQLHAGVPAFARVTR